MVPLGSMNRRFAMNDQQLAYRPGRLRRLGVAQIGLGSHRVNAIILFAFLASCTTATAVAPAVRMCSDAGGSLALVPQVWPCTDPRLSEENVCFHGHAPEADAQVADLPMPTAIGCPVPAPPCSTDLELSVFVDVPGSSTPTESSPWAPIVEGAQGAAHVVLNLHADLGPDVPKQKKVSIHAWLCVDGRVIATRHTDAFLYAQAQGPMASSPGNSPGLRVIFPGFAGWALTYCGAWAHVTVQVIDPVTLRWGQAEREIRLYTDAFTVPQP